MSHRTGVPLQSVTAGGAAAKAGLQAGDVVTKINDFATTTADGLIAATRFYAPGTEVHRDLHPRRRHPQTVTVTLGHQVDSLDRTLTRNRVHGPRTGTDARR